MSRGGMIWRMAPSTRSASCAVSSMRVPVLARMCRMNWPLSVSGKKFWPSHGTSSEGRDADRQEDRDEHARGGAPRGQQRRDRRRGTARSHARSPAATEPADCATAPRDAAWPSADTSPSSAPGCATARRRRAWRTPRLPPAARTDSARRRPAGTSARTRCRCTASTPAPAPRSARRRAEWRRAARAPSSR